jgi:Tol biopolymer transport system component
VVFLAVAITVTGMLAGASIAATDNGRIVYAGFDEATGGTDLYSVDPDGTDVQRLTADGADKGHPEWSPDGTAISFESVGYESGSCCSRNIYSIDADGSDRRRLTETPDVSVGENFDATWAPDGSWLAFVSDRGDTGGFSGDRELYRMNADGSGETQLTFTDGRTSDQQPAISPDGSTIAFASDRANSGSDELLDIYTLDVDSTGVERLTSDGAYRYPLSSRSKSPAWSPDGTRIAYESTRTGNSEIWVMDADGTDPVNVSDAPGADTEPAWSPDGAQITFTSTRSGEEDVWTVDAPAASTARSSLRAALTAAPARAAAAAVNLTAGEAIAARSPDWGTTPVIGRPACTQQGTNGSETLIGTPGPDVLCGRGGNDVIRGGDGDDIIRGGAGRDRTLGDAGNDYLVGGPDADELFGGHGADLLRSRDAVIGNDLLDGGRGIDTKASDPQERSIVAVP